MSSSRPILVEEMQNTPEIFMWFMVSCGCRAWNLKKKFTYSPYKFLHFQCWIWMFSNKILSKSIYKICSFTCHRLSGRGICQALGLVLLIVPICVRVASLALGMQSHWSSIEEQSNCQAKKLTHWGRVTHICVARLIIIGSDNGLSPDQHQAIIWTNARFFQLDPCEHISVKI